MKTITHATKKMLEGFTEDYKKIFGSDLLSIIFHENGGWSASGDETSDFECIVILSEAGIKGISRSFRVASKWKKHKVDVPLFLTRDDIVSSLDSFPVEFINIKTDYMTIYGEDILKNIVFDGRLVRIQCEREIKRRLLKLRQDFIKTEGNAHKIAALISFSLPAVFMLFKVVIFMRQHKIIADRKKLLDCVVKETGLNSAFFAALLAIKEGEKQLLPEDAVACMESYIDEMARFSAWIDTLDAESKNDRTDHVTFR